MADCSKNVNAMLAVCRAIGTLAQGNSKHLAAAAKLCHDTCSDCAAACKPHIGHHEECKACFEACNETIKVAKTFI
jgi:Cys-rich four helix bundle protein (predicted Tat secretion target)